MEFALASLMKIFLGLKKFLGFPDTNLSFMKVQNEKTRFNYLRSFKSSKKAILANVFKDLNIKNTILTEIRDLSHI